MLLFLELTWRTSQRKWISRWDIICLERLYEEDSIRQSSSQNDAAATAQTRSREKKTLEMLRSPLQSSSVRIPPTREIHFFNRFSVFCFFVFLSFHAWVQTHWGSGRGSRGADTAELNSEPWKSERDKRAQNACEGGSSLPLIDWSQRLQWGKARANCNKLVCFNVISKKSVPGCKILAAVYVVP